MYFGGMAGRYQRAAVMKKIEVTMAHIYLTESDKRLNQILAKLHDEEKVRGVTVVKGVTGFGRNGHIHSSSLIDMSFDLPLIIEFFDTDEKVQSIVEHLGDLLKPGHVVTWPATIFE